MTSNAQRPPHEDEPAVVRRRPGRPRSSPTTEFGGGTRDEILDAAARLFAQQGYEGTTTRQIAELVGIKQASLYYHFADKASIVVALLDGTASPAVGFSEWLHTVDAGAETKLYALAAYDLDVILNDPWSMHDLLQIAEVAARQRQHGRAAVTTLQSRYLELARECARHGSEALGARSVPESDLVLVFGLVESIVAQRYWGGLSDRAAYAESVPRGCLRLLGVPEHAVMAAAEEAERLIASYPKASSS